MYDQSLLYISILYGLSAPYYYLHENLRLHNCVFRIEIKYVYPDNIVPIRFIMFVLHHHYVIINTFICTIFIICSC